MEAPTNALMVAIATVYKMATMQITTIYSTQYFQWSVSGSKFAQNGISTFEEKKQYQVSIE